MTLEVPGAIRDPERLAAVRRTTLLDTAPDDAFDRLTRVATRVLDTRIAMISLIDGDRQFVKSQIGLDRLVGAGRQLSFDQSICKYAVAARAPITIHDTRRGPLAREHPGLSASGIVAYAGVPLITRDGHAVGTFCVADAVPRVWSDDELDLLSDLAASVVDKIELQAEIGERKRAEARLREANDALSALVEASPVAIITLDASGTVATWNPAAERVFGWAEDEVLGEHPPIVPRERRDELRRLVEAERRGRGSVPYETRSERKDGEPVDVVLRVAALRDSTGSVSGFLCIAVDVTERRQLERRRQQVQKMEALARLATGIAHDFNNLFMAIRGNCDLLLEDLPAGDPRRAGLEEIARATDSAVTLTRQLLAINGRSPARPATLDLNAVVEETTGMLRRVLGEDIELITVTAAAPPRLTADQGQLEQLLVNLAVNARDAMPDGGRLTVRTAEVALGGDYARLHPDVRPGRYAMLSVTDTGRGMSPETLARVFEPFYSGKPNGSGLGLTIAERIVAAHGGRIEIESAPGTGTRVTLLFPVEAA